MTRTTVLFCVLTLFSTVLMAAPGDLDTSFGTNGLAFASYSSNSAVYGQDSIVDLRSGEITVTGELHLYSQGAIHMLLARFRSDGRLDTTFGTGGWVDAHFGYTSIYGRAIARQSDGKLVVVGGQSNPGTSSFAIARFSANGSPDPTFGTAGLKIIPWGPDSHATDVAIQSDGKIVVFGQASTSAGNRDFGVMRFNPDGSYDTSFFNLGWRVINFGNSEEPAKMAIQQDGKIVLSGSTITSSNSLWAVARLNPSGSMDSTFGSGGKVTYDWFSGLDLGRTVSIQSDGKIIFGGEVQGQSGSVYFGLVRFHSNGTPELSQLTDVPQSDYDVPRVSRVASNGRILLGGGTDDDHESFALACYTSTGYLDSEFGTNGLVTTDPGNDYDAITDIHVLRANRILAVGGSTNAPGNTRIVLALYYGCGPAL